MPYVVRSSRAPITSQLNRYVRAVRGMGDDEYGGDDYSMPTDVTPGYGIDSTPFNPLPFNSSDTSNLQSQAASESVGIGSSLQAAYQAATAPAAGGGFNIAAFMNALAGGAAAGAKVYNSTQSPYLIPGTSSIYNPATGQLMGLPANTSSLLLYGGLAVGAFLLFSMLGKK